MELLSRLMQFMSYGCVTLFSVHGNDLSGERGEITSPLFPHMYDIESGSEEVSYFQETYSSLTINLLKGCEFTQPLIRYSKN